MALLEPGLRREPVAAVLRRTRRGDPRMIERLDGPEAAVEAAWRALTREVSPPRGSEWFLDNHHVVDRAIAEVRRALGGRFEAHLPRLPGGEPRVYAVASQASEGGLGHVDEHGIREVIEQQREPLATAELWALPLALRIALIEGLAGALGAVRTGGEGSAAADRIVANCIRSLRALEAIDWTALFERHSALEAVLRSDPAGVYAEMDFQTRDRYRRQVERLARGTDRSEVEVAQLAIERAGAGGHVGRVLIGEERIAFERALGYRPPLRVQIRRALRARPALAWFGAVGLACVAIEALLAAAIGPRPIAALALLVGLPLAWGLAVSLAGWGFTAILPPDRLPKLDLEEGLRPCDRTLVAVPSLLSDADEVDALLARLEIHHLGNPDPHLRFALVTDFVDAPVAEMPSDGALLERARAGIEALNARHGGAPFLLLHRERDHNPAEGCFMGWERKRGKLVELDLLLLGRPREGAWTVVGDAGALREVRYVVTLDADTVVPRGSVVRMVGAMAHPLNRPRFDPATGRVVAGHAVLQPRVEVSPIGGSASAFARIFSGARGLDPYAHAVSDVYQDLFGRGVYVGKGIYDVQAFERALEGRVPENALLSHDLLEGLYARAGLLSDVVVLEEYPRSVAAWSRRQHRWIRGDWQLLPWLRRRSGLPAIGRFQILDNLRRSLEAPAMLAALLVAWFALPGAAEGATLLVVCAPIAAAAPGLLAEAVRRAQPGMEPPPSAPQLGRQAADTALRVALELALLPFVASVALDAVLRTLVRLAITRRHLLQWTTAAATDRLVAGQSLRSTWVEMAAAPVVAGLIAAGLFASGSGAWPVAAPLLAVWLLSPALARRLSRPAPVEVRPPGAGEVAVWRRLCRRTSLFFEVHAGPEHHWLAPDHLQVSPGPRVAARTSPTNVGFGLLATLAGSDLGYVGPVRTYLRLRNAVETAERVERYRGHLYNWYDTRSLAPLEPRYVSTVDSGNLAAALVVVRQGCRELASAPVLGPSRWEGLVDTLSVLEELLVGVDVAAGAVAAVRAIHAAAVRPPQRLSEGLALAGSLERDGCAALDRELIALIATHPALPAEEIEEIRLWAARIREHLSLMQQEVRHLAPWLAVARPVGSAPPEVEALLGWWDGPVAIDAVAARCAAVGEALDAIEVGRLDEPWRRWCGEVRDALGRGAEAALGASDGLSALADRVEQLIGEMDFRFLYDEDRQLLRIGFDASADRPDPNHYDLLASEARLTSLLAIATGQVPPSHWLHLGRPLGRPGRAVTLLSWSGSMFEYLMAPLLLREGGDTLLGQSARAAVQEHVAWGRRCGVPWGCSESGFAHVDADDDYQYRAFGVPSLGFKRGLANDVVVAPYATALAVGIAPQQALENLDALVAAGALGRYGLYEAVDFTPSRLPPGSDRAVVRSFMAHHQGMALIALVNRVRDGLFVRRFHADRAVRTVEALLFESSPRRVPLERHRPVPPPPRARSRTVLPPPWEPEPGGVPERMALSNGELTVIGGPGGWSTWRGLEVTRRGGGFGLWIEEEGQRAWPNTVRWLLHGHMVERHAWWEGLALRERVTVAPEDDVEVRLVTLVNESPHHRRVVLGGYAEIALGDPGEAERHPAFSRMFVESAYDERRHGLLFHRRPRRDDAPRAWLLQLLAMRGPRAEVGGFESDREAFLGRHGRDRERAGLLGRTGPVLDPVAVLSASLDLPPGEAVDVAFVSVLGDRRAEVLRRAEAYRELPWIEWTFDRARGRAEDELGAIGLQGQDLPVAAALLSRVLHPWHGSRAPAEVLLRSRLGQPALWRFALSGDLPIVAVSIDDPDDIGTVTELLRAWALWRRRGVWFDLVVLNERSASYDAAIEDGIWRRIAELHAEVWVSRPGGIFPIAGDRLSSMERDAMLAAARVVVRASAGSLGEQLGGDPAADPHLAPLVPLRDPPAPEPLDPVEPLELRSRWGGFCRDRSTYVLRLAADGTPTPAPWCNVVANARGFGTLVSESGSGYTWAENAGEHRLTAWSNDPVLDPPSETLYLRDEETAAIWSPTPRPAPGRGGYEVRHEAGRTTFVHRSNGLDQSLAVSVDRDDPVKVLCLRLTDRTGRQRRVTATFVVEWLLGSSPQRHGPHVVGEVDADREVFFARNAWSPGCPDAVAFAAATRRLHGLTGDRLEVFGRPERRDRPPGLVRIGLGSVVAPGRDPCAALQVHLDLAPGGTEEVCFLLGHGEDRADALRIVSRMRDPVARPDALSASLAWWEERLGVVRIETPSPAIDALANRWLLYQAMSSRMLGRTGFYQSSGAYGFRDQLQDAAALGLVDPARWREHLLRCAAVQFREGDVLHWWHPPAGAGIRSRCSDDLAWLPWSVAAYVAATGDLEVLSEGVPWLEGAPLAPGETERYARWSATAETATLYRHGMAAIERAWALGPSGLPRIGSGDWNDGLDRVGIGGRGESVWLGWFLVAVARAYAPLCAAMGEEEAAAGLRERAERLAAAIEAAAWDGAWYRRATFDDGAPLGTAGAAECEIDAIAQAWAVLSGAGSPERAERALQEVQRRLVRESEGLILLLAPPFDRMERDPGYIRAYPRGVRENGGQYTHAAIWTLWALLDAGHVDRAVALFERIAPTTHAATDPERYRAEPYVLAADIYSEPPHVGRGGWTWYTGSAAWAWRFVVEGVLGLRLEQGALRIAPALPEAWPGYRAQIRRGETRWEIEVGRGPEGYLALDGVEVASGRVPLDEDGRSHRVEVILAARWARDRASNDG